jgi:hypothetical protein
MRLDSAKLAVVEYAITNRFGPQSDLKPQVIADMLGWKKMTSASAEPLSWRRF